MNRIEIIYIRFKWWLKELLPARCPHYTEHLIPGVSRKSYLKLCMACGKSFEISLSEFYATFGYLPTVHPCS